MLTRKTLVLAAGLVIITALMIALSLNPATVTAQGPAPQPPVAVLRVLGVPANAALPNPITSTIKYMTDTVVGEKSSAVAMGTSGLKNVPVNVPIRLQVAAKDPKNTGKPTWAIANKPAGSKAAFKDAAAMTAEFTPDVAGAYQVSVVLKNDAGATSTAEYAFFTAGTYVGIEKGNCKQCHAQKFAEWSETGHASIFTREIDNKDDGPNGLASHYSETCIRCHTTGYFAAPVGAGSGGFMDAKTATKWAFPTQKQIDDAFAKKAPSNWESAPAEVKNMANIQCEQCHGPASEHVKSGAKTMSVSMANSTCDVCHAGGGHHIRGLEIMSSKHTVGTSFEEINGPARQACVRCHSAEGFVSFLKDPKNPAAWSNEEGAVGCATCHDPHDDKNFAQLRVVGMPVELPFEAKKDVGLSAVCFTCHNARSNAADAIKSSTPHYASNAEFLSDTGGVTYGQNVPNSPHGAIVGAAPLPNPAYDAVKNPTVAKFLYSKAGDAKGNSPGPCVTCHMAAPIDDAKDANFMKVGDHSFNTVSPDGTFDYGAGCKSCHGDVKDFNLKAKADYDGNGKIEGVQDEVKGLLNVLWKGLESKGLKKVETGYPYASVPKDAQGNVDDKIDNAWYNFRTVYGVMWGTGPDGKPAAGNEGKAAAIHNFKRAVALLQLSIKDLTGSLGANTTEMK